MNNESGPESVNARFFAGFGLAVAFSLVIWGGAGLGVATAHPHFARAAYHKVKPVLHQARLFSEVAIDRLFS